MRNLFLVFFLLIGSYSFGQTVTLTDWDNNNVIEYVKVSDCGKKVEEGNIIDGKYHGQWRTYHLNGNLNTIAQFNMGRRDGLWKFFNEEGLLVSEVLFVDNRRVSATQVRYFE